MAQLACGVEKWHLAWLKYMGVLAGNGNYDYLSNSGKPSLVIPS